MSEPLVCAIMLTRDRPEMAARAVRSFESQTWNNKRLIIFDTGSGQITRHRGHFQHCEIGGSQLSIGALRNRANAMADEGSIVIHFDDDDVSHPNRIAEQVAHLQQSGADVVGYNELLFWRQNRCPVCGWPLKQNIADGCVPDNCSMRPRPRGEAFPAQAWLYQHKNARAGSSFCYWRKTWERKPFPDLNRNEDYQWCQGLDLKLVSSVFTSPIENQPRMVCSIHGANTLDYDIEGMIARGGERNWKRAPEWDTYCAERLKL